MKYAQFANIKAGEYMSTVGQVNMGDSIQSFAIAKIFKEAGVEEKDIVKIPFFAEEITVDEPCYLVVQGHFGRQYDMEFMHNPYIHPIFMGFALKDAVLLEEEVEYYKKYEPILCRDEFTKNALLHYGVEAYISGCLSAIFPSRTAEDGGKRDKYYFVDVKEKFIDMLPDYIRENAVFTTQNIHIDNMNEFSIMQEEENTRKRMEEYKQNAKMVITPKLHCMIPCVAMGIPTIAVGANFSYRYTFADLFLEAYDEERFRNYDWSIPQRKPELETIKKLLLDVGVSMVKQEPDMEKIRQLDRMYLNRNKWNYCQGIKKQLREAFSGTEAPQYILWGAAAGGYTVYEAIKELWRENEMLAIVDSFAGGVFAGQEVQKPDDAIEKYPNAAVIISTLSGRKNAEELLQKMGKKKNKDYFIIHESL